jgi:hypothetical protein
MSIPITHTNREAWLLAALPSLVALLDQAGAPAFPTPLLSVGFPFGIRTGNGKAIGQCWTLTDQERAHIFVHPCLDDPLQVLNVVAHELIHAAVGCQHGHRGPFASVARALGLEGRLTATTAGPALLVHLVTIANRVGAYPHRALDPQLLEQTRKKQGTRMRKYACPCCGQILRAATDDLRVVCAPCSDATGAAVAYRLEGGRDAISPAADTTAQR